MENLNFHGDDVVPAFPDRALFHVIPAPFEASVSYGSGTKAGPEAVIEASKQLELFDNHSCPADYGIFTAKSVDCAAGTDASLKRIKDAVKTCLNHEKLPVVIGGEHTVSVACIDALIEKYGTDFGVIQFDAHADLRESYEGSPLSHACVMKRIVDRKIPIYQIGVRSYSKAEYETRKKYGIPYLDAEYFAYNGIAGLKLPPDFPEKVFITFDVDCFDASVMAATGTPVPGGLNWWDTMTLLKKIIESKICLGFDVVEFSPISGLHCYEFTVAQLIYNIMGYITRTDNNKKFWQITD